MFAHIYMQHSTWIYRPITIWPAPRSLCDITLAKPAPKKNDMKWTQAHWELACRMSVAMRHAIMLFSP